MFDAQTKLYGLLGHPLAHSLSPLMQNYFLEQTGLNGVYLAFPVKPEALEMAVKGLFALGVGGINVTIPYKETVMPYLRGLTEAAALCQAVNTLIPTENGFIGDNTDGQGLLAALYTDYQWQAVSQTVLLVGAGGAAKGVAAALALAGAKKIFIANRSRAKAEALCELIVAHSKTEAVSLDLADLADHGLYQEADILINSTSLGMGAQRDLMPPIALKALEKRHLVVDLIYNPQNTRLLQAADEIGARTVSGIGMLIEQGALAFERWTGQRPPTEGLKNLVQAELVQKK